MLRLRCWLWIAGCLALSLGCPASTPAEVCEEHRRLLNDWVEVCGSGTYQPEVWLAWEDGPCEGMTTSCEFVSEIASPGEFTEGCLDVLAEMDCDQWAGGLGEPVFCFDQYRGVTRSVCAPP